jgi:hypothetical protein
MNPPPPAPVTLAPVAPAASAPSTASSICEFVTPEASVRLASQLFVHRGQQPQHRQRLADPRLRSPGHAAEAAGGSRSAVFADCSLRIALALRVMPVRRARAHSRAAASEVENDLLDVDAIAGPKRRSQIPPNAAAYGPACRSACGSGRISIDAGSFGQLAGRHLSPLIREQARSANPPSQRTMSPDPNQRKGYRPAW